MMICGGSQSVLRFIDFGGDMTEGIISLCPLFGIVCLSGSSGHSSIHLWRILQFSISHHLGRFWWGH